VRFGAGPVDGRGNASLNSNDPSPSVEGGAGTFVVRSRAQSASQGALCPLPTHTAPLPGYHATKDPPCRGIK